MPVKPKDKQPKTISPDVTDKMTSWVNFAEALTRAISTAIVETAAIRSSIRIEEFKTKAAIAIENNKAACQLKADNLDNDIQLLTTKLDKVEAMGVSIPQNVKDAIIVNNVLCSTFKASTFMDYDTDYDDEDGVPLDKKARYSRYSPEKEFKNAISLFPHNEEGA